MFDTCDVRQCTKITIVNDVALENDEIYIFSLTSPGLDDRITFNPAIGEIRIHANDGMVCGYFKLNCM